MKRVELQIDDRRVASVFLNRPHRHHALSSEMIAELSLAADKLAVPGAARVAVIASRGPIFCAGADLNWMKVQFASSREQRRQAALGLARMLSKWNELPLPVIAKVQGNGYGGALGLIAIADKVIASNGASFTFSEVRLGLIPATISPFVVARIGSAGGREVMLDASVFSAARARDLGLVNQVVPAEELGDEVERAVRQYLKCSPQAIARAKAFYRRLVYPIDERVLNLAANELAECWESSEAQAGVQAFLERRTPTSDSS